MPRRVSGLTSFAISHEQQPGLHELFTDLAENGIDLLDPVLDLNDEERQLLLDNGILVPSDAVPEKALFSCLLDGVGPREIPDPSILTVNPSFEYRALDFSNMTSRLWGEHLSGRPSAWVTEEVTGIERLLVR